MPTDVELASSVAAAIIEKHDWPRDAVDELLARAVSSEVASRVFFREVVERVCDLFDPDATRVYADLFAYVIARILPGYSHSELVARYRRIRRESFYSGEPRKVCVLSRVTLGADIVVTSIMLDAAKRRFPDAEVCFVGPAKNAALFGADPRVRSIHTSYGRSAVLPDRLYASAAAAKLLADKDTLVIDPDSRLSQLGVMPVAGEDRYLFFESRAYGGDSAEPLSALAARWSEKALGVSGARAFLNPKPLDASAAAITISLGVGENQEKRAGDELERAALEKLLSLGCPVLIDAGAGGEETERVEQLRRAVGDPKHLHIHRGSFASFAAHILQSRLYFGYDSAGQHVAAAGGVPLVTVFAGYAAERTFQRWYPTGTGPIHVIKGSESDLIARVEAALISAAAEAGLS